jgi:para-aminobenzoate synthetase component 2
MADAARPDPPTASPPVRVLVIDNYDSFVYNLVHYLAQLGADCTVRRNDAVTTEELDQFDAVLISPGPGTPEAAGVSVPMVQACAERRTPLLGVCLGHQAITVAFGGVVAHAPELLHGKVSEVFHDGAGVLADQPNPFTATRYHSLAAVEASLPESLEVTGRTASGVIMALRHRELPIEGVQFHPESILTQGGHLMLANWLAACGDSSPRERAAELGAAITRLQETAAGRRG